MTPAAMIRTARLEAGLTQAQLSKRAATSQSAVALYESGRRDPSATTLTRLLAASGATLELRTGRQAVVTPSTAELARRGTELLAVIHLASKLPTRHTRQLNFPSLI